MDERIEKSFDFAADLVKQLITLATAVIALTITFAKDFVGVDNGPHNLWLISAWITFFVSIVCGIWALMAFTGTLAHTDSNGSTPTIQDDNCRIPTALQVLTFLIAVGLTITYAARSL